MTHLAQVLENTLRNTALLEVDARALNHLVHDGPVNVSNSIVRHLEEFRLDIVCEKSMRRRRMDYEVLDRAVWRDKRRACPFWLQQPLLERPR